MNIIAFNKKPCESEKKLKEATDYMAISVSIMKQKGYEDWQIIGTLCVAIGKMLSKVDPEMTNESLRKVIFDKIMDRHRAEFIESLVDIFNEEKDK